MEHPGDGTPVTAARLLFPIKAQQICWKRQAWFYSGELLISVLEAFSSNVSNEESDIQGKEVVQGEARALHSSLNVRNGREGEWRVMSCIVFPTQSSPVQIIHLY